MMQRVNIFERADESRTDDIVMLERGCFSDSWSRQSVLDTFLLEDRCFIILCTTDGEPSGYIICSCVVDEVEIQRIGVLPQFRRLGLGGLLVREAKRYALVQSRGSADYMYLEVRRSNTAAVALYRSCGFKEFGLRRGYYSNPTEDAVLMCCKIG